MSHVASTPTSDALWPSQTRVRDEEDTLGRGERHELVSLYSHNDTYPLLDRSELHELHSSHTRNDIYPTTQNGGTDSGTNSRTNVGTDDGIDYHRVSGTDWHQVIREDEVAFISFVHRFIGRGRWVPWGTSAVNVARSSGVHALDL